MMNKNSLNTEKPIEQKNTDKLFLFYGCHILAFLFAILITVIQHIHEIKIDMMNIHWISNLILISWKTIVITLMAMILMFIGLAVNLMAMGKITRKIVEIHVYPNIKYKTLVAQIMISSTIMLFAYLIIKLH